MPKSDDKFEQFSSIMGDIDRTIAKFAISGEGVSGNIRDGFIVNARPGPITDEGTTPPTAGCPHLGDITVELSGITLCSGCQDLSSFGAGSINNLTGDINGIFILPRSLTGPPIDQWSDGGLVGASILEYDAYSDDSCNIFTNHAAVGFGIIVVCNLGGWNILVNDGNSGFFLNLDQSSPTGITNGISCGTIADPLPVFGGTGVWGSGDGGTATITF